MKLTYIIKLDDNSFDLAAIGLQGNFSLNILSTLFLKDYEIMLEYMEQMRFTNHYPFYYFFPKYKNVPEIDLRLVKCSEDDYKLVLNLGSHILSEMNTKEFDELHSKLSQLPLLSIGSKVYFLALESKSND